MKWHIFEKFCNATKGTNSSNSKMAERSKQLLLFEFIYNSFGVILVTLHNVITNKNLLIKGKSLLLV